MVEKNNTSELDEHIFTAISLVNNDKNVEAKELVNAILLRDGLQESNYQSLGDVSLAIGDFETSINCFKKSGNLTGIAFSLIMLDRLGEANKILNDLPKSPPSTWCKFLIDVFFEKGVREWPSYLEVRHFMELTIYSMLLAKRHYYIALLLKRLNKLLDINLDAEKLVGYAYFHYGLLNDAIKFLKSSLRNNRSDGEIYFVLGQIYSQQNNIKESISMLENASLFLPDHLPTKLLLQKVKQKVT